MRVTALLLFGLTAFAQPPDAAKHREAIGKLRFLEGKWKGTGSMMMGPGKQNTFTQTEDVQIKAGGTVLLIEGNGVDADGKAVHQALATVGFDEKSGGYRMRSHIASGQFGEFDARLDSDAFIWDLSAPGRTIRYTIRLNEAKQWYETGEMKQGEKWIPFFEMTLTKQ